MVRTLCNANLMTPAVRAAVVAVVAATLTVTAAGVDNHVMHAVNTQSQNAIPPMQLTLVAGSHCLDGSPAGYYFRPAQSQRGQTRWVIYLEGGGLCYDPNSCKSRTKTHLGSSTQWAKNKTGSASVNVDSAKNPDFWDANHVFVPYCTGDLHTGQVNKTGLLTFDLYFSGHENLVKIISHLEHSYAPFKDATDVMLTGDSAGGMGTFYNVDWLADTMHWATVKGVPVGGWFFPGFADDQPDNQWAPPTNYPEWTNNETGAMIAEVGYLTALYRTYIHPNCDEPIPFHCGSVNVMYNHIRAPLFVLQNMYDTNQINSQLFMPGCSGDACTEKQKDFVRYYGHSIRKSTHQILTNERKKDGLFLPSCYAHCEGINIEGTTDINGYKPTELVGDWFFNRNGRNPYRVVDDCPEDLPCNAHCKTMVPEPVPPPETQCATELDTLCSRKTGCFACAMLNLRQLLDALCTISEISNLCASG
eukprot:m.78377 g.78377  ORF g.78377 m.78377 type:complete len:475 (+) comp9215_c0_seq2:46-1470(+)